MATRTASQDGYWDVTSTWGGNPVPVAGDKVALGARTVTIPAGYTANAGDGTSTAIWDSGNSSGSFIMEAGSTLNLSGWLLLGKPLTLGAGVTIVGDATVSGVIRVGLITFNGTSNSRITIRASASGTNNFRVNATSANGNRVSGGFVDFIDLGTSNTNTTNNQFGDGTLTDWTATRCGQMCFGANSDIAATDDIVLRRFTMTGTLTGTNPGLLINNISAATTGLREVSDFAIDKPLLIAHDVKNLILENGVYFKAATIGTSGKASGAFTRIKNIACVSDSSTSATEMHVYAPGPIYRNLWSPKHTAHCIDIRPNAAGTYEFYENVNCPLVDSSGGDMVVVYNESSSPPVSTVYQHNCVNAPTPATTSSYTLLNHASRSKNCTIRIEHNTTAGEIAISQGGGDSISCEGTGLVSSCQSNLYDSTGQSAEYFFKSYSADRKTRTEPSGVTTYKAAWDKGAFTAGTDATHGEDTTASWLTVFDGNSEFGFIPLTGNAAGKYTAITGNTSGTKATVAAWTDGVIPAAGDTYIIVVRDPYDPATVGHNALRNTGTSGRLWRLNGTNVTNITGYHDHFITSGTPGASDIIDQNPNFYDSTRVVATYDTAASGLNNAAATAWSNGASYVVGDIVSSATATFYGNATINFRCIADHTAATATNKPGSGSSWMTNWEFATQHRFRSDRSLIEACVAWCLAGRAPTNSVYKNAGHDSVTIGAVEGIFPASGAAGSRNRSRAPRRMWR